MKRFFFFLAAMMLGIGLSAQTQQGYVKTKGRLANDGSVVAGTRIPNATIQVKDRTPVVSQADGTFSFPIPADKFYLQNVQKQGYVLTDPEMLSKQYSYSANDLIIVMEDLAQREADRRAIERKISNKLYAQLYQRGEELEALKEQNKITEEKYRELLQQLNQDQDDNEKIIKDMAERYTKMDFDQINEFNRKVSEYILNGELTKADSMLRTKGDIHERIDQLNEQHKANVKARADLEKSESLEQRNREDIANDCYSKFEILAMQHYNDSAAYYIELRASLDTTNIDWQLEAGDFLSNDLAEYDKAAFYYARSLSIATVEFDNQNLEMLSVYNCLIRFNERTGHYSEAMQYCNEASLLLKQQKEENNPVIQKSYENMGILFDQLGDKENAFRCYQKSLEISQFLYGETHSTTASAYHNLGAYYQTTNEFDNAIESLCKSTTIYRDLHDTISEGVAANYEALADIYETNGDFEASLECINKAIAINKVIFGENHPYVANNYYVLASILLNKHLFEEALQNFETAMYLYESSFGHNHPSVGSCCNSIGIIHNKFGNPEKALAYYRKALDIFQKLFDENNHHIGGVYCNIGQVYHAMMDYENAAKFEKKALDIYLFNYGENHDKTVICYENLCETYIEMGEYELAMEYAQKALKISKVLYLNENNQSMAYAYNNVANIYNKMEQYDKAIEYLGQSLQILKQIYGEEHTNIAIANYNIGVLYKKQNNFTKAIEYSEEAVEMLLKFLPEDHPIIKQMMESIKEMKEASDQ